MEVQHPIVFCEMLSFVGINCQQKEKFDDLAFLVRVFSLYIVTASNAFQLHSPSTYYMSVNIENEQPLSVMELYVLCFPN
jgi:hypothetical protein